MERKQLESGKRVKKGGENEGAEVERKQHRLKLKKALKQKRMKERKERVKKTKGMIKEVIYEETDSDKNQSEKGVGKE